MNDDQPGPSEDAPACGTLVALGTCAFVAGLALGLTQPLVFVAIGPGVVAGATYVGLLFLACVVIALVTMGLAFFGARWFTVPAFVACGSLALGLLAGNWMAAAFDIGFGSSRPAVATPSPGPPPSTIDSGTVGDETVWVELRLMPPGGLPMSMALPRIQVRLVQPDGTVSRIWTGQGQVEAIEALAGRVAFTDLEASLDGGAGPATLSGELSWTCSSWVQ